MVSNTHVNNEILFLGHEFDERIIPLKMTYLNSERLTVLINLTLEHDLTLLIGN